MLHQTLIDGMCYEENAKLLTVIVSCLNLPKPRTFVVTATIRQPSMSILVLETVEKQLTVEKANKSDHLADYLDLTFIHR